MPGDNSSPDKSGKKTKRKRLLIQGVQEVPHQSSRDDASSPSFEGSMDDGGESSSADVAFIIQVTFLLQFLIYVCVAYVFVVGRLSSS